MDAWDAEVFAKKLAAGEFRGLINEELEKLSEEQLRQLLQILGEKRSELHS